MIDNKEGAIGAQDGARKDSTGAVGSHRRKHCGIKDGACAVILHKGKSIAD
jgi:hypothetical protein